MQKIINYGLIILSLFIGILFYFSFDIEEILWDKYESKSISIEQIKSDSTKDYTRLKAGEGITTITDLENWDKVINDIDYVKVIPRNIEKTNVYSLAKWVKHYTQKANGTSWRKLAETKKTAFDISANYSPYYIIELEDGNYILAQMNRAIANKIKNGENIELPLGKKIGIFQKASQKAKNLLKPICNEKKVSTDYVLYTIDNNWQSENTEKIFYTKFVIAFVLFIVLAVILQLAYDKFFCKNS